MNKIAHRFLARTSLAWLVSTLLVFRLDAQTDAAPSTGVSEARVKELKNLHWGMFICWSFSTFSGQEWTRGVKDISLFRATQADTDQWARTAKDAGMGYILFLTKHHDGFCLWDTKTTDRKVTNTKLRRDVLADLRRSCDKYGIKLALYFSEGEFADNAMYHPGGYTPEMKKAQLKELLTQYGPIEYIWFDHAQGDGGLSHAETVRWCHECQPGTLIGFNHGDAAGEISLRETGTPGPLGDKSAGSFNASNEATYKYLLAEFTYPIEPPHNGGAIWFYSLPQNDKICFPPKKLYRDYLGAVKYGNIFSVDVGPGYNGRLRDIDVATLTKVGEMIRNPDSQADAFQANDGSIKLNAADADLTGGAQLEHLENDSPDIGFWHTVGDSATWKVKVDHPGSFKVSVNYSLDPNSKGSEALISAGSSSVTFTPAVTGGWSNYQLSNGTDLLKITELGIVQVTVTDKENPGGGLMGLRSITLTPAGT